MDSPNPNVFGITMLRLASDQLALKFEDAET